MKTHVLIVLNFKTALPLTLAEIMTDMCDNKANHKVPTNVVKLS